MNTGDHNYIQPLGQYVSSLCKKYSEKETQPYPVLGAEGGTFFIEISVGPLDSRRILLTVFFNIKKEPVVLPTFNPLNTDSEQFISIPDASFLIAFLHLIEKALVSKAQILHPLDDQGNFLPEWDKAVIAATC